MSLEEKENRPDLPDILIAFQPESSDFIEYLAGLLAFLSLTPSHRWIVASGFQLFRSKNLPEGFTVAGTALDFHEVPF